MKQTQYQGNEVSEIYLMIDHNEESGNPEQSQKVDVDNDLRNKVFENIQKWAGPVERMGKTV